MESDAEYQKASMQTRPEGHVNDAAPADDCGSRPASMQTRPEGHVNEYDVETSLAFTGKLQCRRAPKGT